jgi:hypothetical protein
MRMLRILIAIFLVMLLFAFQHNKAPIHQKAILGFDSTRHTPYIDSTLRPIVAAYLDEMKMYDICVDRFYTLDSIVLVKTTTQICDEDNAIGCCDGRVVHVKYFNDAEMHDKDFYLKILIYHELGHCVLQLPHHRAVTSIMNPSNDRPMSVYKSHWDYYLGEYINFYYYVQAHPALKLYD